MLQGKCLGKEVQNKLISELCCVMHSDYKDRIWMQGPMYWYFVYSVFGYPHQSAVLLFCSCMGDSCTCLYPNTVSFMRFAFVEGMF